MSVEQYPMALYHPVTGAMRIAADEDEHMEIQKAWEPLAPEPKPKNKGGRPRKNP